MRETVKAKRKFKNKLSLGTRFRCVECRRVRVFLPGSMIHSTCFCGGQYERFTSAMKRAEKAEKDQTTYLLYAISDGTAVKIGFSQEPEERLRELTGNPRKLWIVWSRFLATGKAAALTAEGEIHEALQKYSLGGEWFDVEALADTTVDEMLDAIDKTQPTKVNQ